MRRVPGFVLAWLFLVCALFVAGCSTLSVARLSAHGADAKPESVPGVPFYLKKRTQGQKTVYRSIWYRVQLIQEEFESAAAEQPSTREVLLDVQTEPGNIEKPAFVRFASRLAVESNDLSRTADQAAATARALGGELESLVPPADLSAIRGMSAINEKFMVLNERTAVFEVDDKMIYFINGRHPISGKGESKFALRDDYTLSEADAKLESKPQDFISAIFPIKEFLSARYVARAPDPPTGAAASVRNTATIALQQIMERARSADVRFIRFRVIAEPQGEVHTLWCPLDNIKFASCGLKLRQGCHPNWKVQSLAEASVQPPATPTKPEPAWQIQGSLTPPKSK
jgi:hypothetical protein